MILASVSGACGTDSKTASASATLRSAANATAEARSFTLSVTVAEVTYEAPDRVQQVEHGLASTATASGDSTSATSGTFPQTITKVFIGDRYYEADGPDGQVVPFTVAERCKNDQNAAEYVLRILRAIATSGDGESSGSEYTVHIPDQGGTLPTAGTVTISEGFVQTLTFAPGQPGPAVTIGSINNAPPVTAPASSTPTNYSCG